METGSNKVAVFKSYLLEISETFILEQCLNYKRWSPTLLGIAMRSNGLNIAKAHSHVVFPDKWPNNSQIYRRFMIKIGMHNRMLEQHIRFAKYKILHIHFGTELFANWDAFSRLNIPIIVTLHGYDISVKPCVWQAGQYGKAMINYPKKLVELSRRQNISFIAVSDSIREKAIDYGIVPEKITTQYLGVDTVKFAPSKDKISERGPKVLFVGRLVEKKGCIILLKALRKIRDLIPDVSLTVIGDGPERNACEDFARDNNLPVIFLGSRNSNEVLSEINLARCMCIPSITANNGDAEGLPIALLEAQSCGVPVITSACGGATEGIANGVTGISFPERDEESLASALKSVLLDNDCVDKMSIAAASRMRRIFSLHNCVNELEKIYSCAVDNWAKEKARISTMVTGGHGGDR